MKHGPKPKLGPQDEYLIIRWYWQGNYLKDIAATLGVSKSLLSRWIKPLRLSIKTGSHAATKERKQAKQKCHVVESRRRWRFRMEAEGRCIVCGLLEGHKDWCKMGIKKVWG